MNYDKLYFDLDKSVVDNWYWLHTNQYGKELMIDVIKLKIDNGGNFEFNEDYTKFRKCSNVEEIGIALETHNGQRIPVTKECLPPIRDKRGAIISS